MANLAQIQATRQKWAETRPQGGGNNLYLKGGDVAFVHFIGTGSDEGDPYLEIFLAHDLPATEQGGFNTLKYCPVASGHDVDYDCEYCGDFRLKERMMMWFYVYDVLTPKPRDGENLPVVNYGGTNYYRREMNRPMIWDQSAWRESPLDEIIFIHSQLGNLRAKQMILRAVGDGLQRRYRITVNHETQPFNEALLENHPGVVRPIRDVLLDQLKPVETVVRPADGVVATYAPPGAAPVAYAPETAQAAVPTYGNGSAPPANEAPPPQPSTQVSPFVPVGSKSGDETPDAKGAF